MIKKFFFVQAEIRQGKFLDLVILGLRLSLGAIFLAHGLGKFNPGFLNFMNSLGFPPEMQIPLALAETVPGILLIVGVLTRFSSILLAIVMMGAIFFVKHAANLTGNGGFEIDLILLASNLVIIVTGPGRISISHLAKKLPRFLH